MGILKTLPIELPRIDADTQSRVAVNQDVVEEYADLIAWQEEWPFPPLDVFHDGTDYYVADGFHRLLGALRTKRGTIPCRVHKGTARDARIFAMTANDRHGLRMTREDKRACVGWLLDNGGKMTQEAVAAAAGVSVRTVRTIVADRKYEPVQALPVSPPQPVADRQTSATPSGGDPNEPIDVDSEPVEDPDYGKCPNCLGTKWNDEDEDVFCLKCHQPHGEPAGDVDEERINTQRQKTVKTAEALMRAFDDLNLMLARAEHAGVISDCKRFINIAKGWRELK